MKLIICSLLVLVSFVSNAQQLLMPSKKSFEKKWIKNTSYQMRWFALRDTARFEIGKVTTNIAAGKENLVIVTNVEMKNMKTLWIDSTVADINTLRPIRHTSSNMQRDMQLDFGKTRITGFYNDKIKKLDMIVSDTAKTEYFDSNLYPFLIGWLPLANGYTQEIAIYDYNPAAKTGLLKASVKSVSEGTYQSAKSGIRNVWIVTVSDEIGNGENGVSTYYFDKTDRKLWKQEINAGGHKMLMEVVE